MATSYSLPGVCVTLGVGALLVWWFWRHRGRKVSTTWEEVGEVSQLNIYPLKSGRGVSVVEAEATCYGFTAGGMQDRSFLVMKKDGPFLTGRQNPKLTLVKVKVEGEEVTFQFGDTEVVVDLSKVAIEGQVVDTSVFGGAVKGYDCGDEVAQWMTQEVFSGRTSVRVLYNGGLTDRPVDNDSFYHFRQIRKTDKAIYADSCAYLLVAESSLDDLNTRLSSPVTIDRFRGNIVVRGSMAYDEDDWAIVKIGETVLRRLKPCDRCIFTTVDPIKGTKDPNQEPFVTLKSYRILTEPEALAKAWAKNPIFGSHLGTEVPGKVRVGEKVLVARTSQNPLLKF